MRFPPYNRKKFPPSEMTLGKAYMHAIGEHEAGEQSSRPKGPLRRISADIGRACLKSHTDYNEALGQMWRLRRRLREYTLTATPESRRQADMLIQLTNLLFNDKKRTQHPRLRAEMHGQAITALSQVSHEASPAILDEYNPSKRHGVIKSLRGESGHYRVLSTLSRTRHPWFLPVPSLPHHDDRDDSNSQRSFDHALIEYGVHTESPILHKLQVKNTCFGLCNRTDDQDRTDYFASLRARYDSDIVLISGCCDFQFEDPDRAPEEYDAFLMQEWQDELGKIPRQRLNDASRHILYIATHGVESDRSGTFGLVSP